MPHGEQVSGVDPDGLVTDDVCQPLRGRAVVCKRRCLDRDVNAAKDGRTGDTDTMIMLKVCHSAVSVVQPSGEASEKMVRSHAADMRT